MVQKVISVNIFINVPNGVPYQELDFPQVTAALKEGYKVKQVVQSMLPGKSDFNLTFILE